MMSRDDVDRECFVKRLVRLVREEAVVLCAYALLDNRRGIARAGASASTTACWSVRNCAWAFPGSPSTCCTLACAPA